MRSEMGVNKGRNRIEEVTKKQRSKRRLDERKRGNQEIASTSISFVVKRKRQKSRHLPLYNTVLLHILVAKVARRSKYNKRAMAL